MNWMILKDKTGNQISSKHLLIILVVGIFIVTGVGLSGLWANEDHPGDDWDDHSDNYQNTTQAQKAHRVAIKATLEDDDVAQAIADAKESGTEEDREYAKELFRTTYRDFKDEVSELRSSGWGWGEIARHFELHPSVLGQGHYKFSNKYHYAYSKQTHMQSEIKAATARSYKGEDTIGHYGHAEGPNGKSYGLSRNKARTTGNGRGLALGHSKSKGSNSLAGYGAGPGNGHGNGHGGGKGNGHGGGKGK